MKITIDIIHPCIGTLSRVKSYLFGLKKIELCEVTLLDLNTLVLKLRRHSTSLPIIFDESKIKMDLSFNPKPEYIEFKLTSIKTRWLEISHPFFGSSKICKSGWRNIIGSKIPDKIYVKVL